MDYSPRREAAYLAAVDLREQEATKRAMLMELMGDRLADGPAPVPISALIDALVEAKVDPWKFPGSPNRRHRDPAHKAMVRHMDALLARLVSDGYLRRARWQQRAKGGIPLPYTWDLGPQVLTLCRERTHASAAGGAL